MSHEHNHEHGDHSHDHSDCCGHHHADTTEDTWSHAFFLALECVILFMTGLIIVTFVATGRMDIYLQGWLRPMSLIGGLGIMVMGIFNWFNRTRNAGCTHDHGTDEPHHHDGTITSRAFTLLFLTAAIVSAAALTPDAYSSSFLQNKEFSQESRRPAAKTQRALGDFDQTQFEKYAQKNSSGQYILDVIGLNYAGSDPAYMDFLAGRTIETSGQIALDRINPAPNHFRVYILQVNCCMSDARPFSIPIVIEGDVSKIVENGWYKVSGELDFVDERNVKKGRLKSAKAESIPRPRQGGFLDNYK